MSSMPHLSGLDAGSTPRESPIQAGTRTEVPANGNDTTRFAAVAEEVFTRYSRTWKPGTIAVNRSYLRSQIMPWFRDRAIAEITHSEVQRWLTRLHATPAAANRSLSVLSVVLRQAEVYGYRPENSNPCTGVRRYQSRFRERFLTVDETRHLGAALRAREAAAAVPAVAVRLLLLTGCRQSEIRGLRWSDYREGHLFLRGSKVGPRTVWLSSPARALLDRLPRTAPWAFPASNGAGPLSAGTLDRFWRTLREEAGLPDLRLHDLRHSFASFALRQGESVLTIGRLLGHRDPTTTLRYTHVADAHARDAVEAVGASLAG